MNVNTAQSVAHKLMNPDIWGGKNVRPWVEAQQNCQLRDTVQSARSRPSHRPGEIGGYLQCGSGPMDWVLSGGYAPGSLAVRRLPAVLRNLEEG
jgi:hypothetical protein